MSKSNKKAPKTVVAPTGPVITVLKADAKYDGARAAWYAALLAHDGKSLDAFLAECTKTPPAMPKSGKAEDPRGWMRWFIRRDIAKVA